MMTFGDDDAPPGLVEHLRRLAQLDGDLREGPVTLSRTLSSLPPPSSWDRESGGGGFGGGGGAGLSGGAPVGGSGGFGGGGGIGNVAGSGGFGAGNAGNGGGGGAGLGGAVFVRQGATLNITGGGFSGNAVTAGAGSGTGVAGSAIGSAVFLAGSTNYTVSAGTVTIADTIGGGTNALITGGFTKSGPGTLVLNGANSYTGGTTISAGTLEAGAASALGVGNVTVAANAVLRVANAALTLGGSNTLTLNGRLELSGNASAGLPAGASLANFLALSNVTNGLEARIRSGGTLGGTVSALWATGPATSRSDSGDLSTGLFGGLADPFVLPMEYSGTASGQLMLGWKNLSNQWVNAVEGNSVGSPTFFSGGWDQYLVANPSATATSALGTWGHDSATNTVWAALDHNSEFAVMPVPEPAGAMVAVIALVGLVAYGQKKSTGGHRR